MKDGRSLKSSKNLAIVGILVLLICQLGFHMASTNRMQASEERIYTDLHKLEVEVIKLKEKAQ